MTERLEPERVQGHVPRRPDGAGSSKRSRQGETKEITKPEAGEEPPSRARRKVIDLAALLKQSLGKGGARRKARRAHGRRARASKPQAARGQAAVASRDQDRAPKRKRA